MDWKNTQEYLHWMQFLEYMPGAARERARESFENGEWPEIEIIPPKNRKEKRRLTALLPKLISHVMEECGTGKKCGGGRDECCKDVPKRVCEAGEPGLFFAEVFHPTRTGDTNGGSGGKGAGDPADITQGHEDGVYIVDLFRADGLHQYRVRDIRVFAETAKNPVFECEHGEILLQCSVEKVAQAVQECK